METIRLCLYFISFYYLCFIRVLTAPAGVSKPNSAKPEDVSPGEGLKISKSGFIRKAENFSGKVGRRMDIGNFDDEYLTAAMLEFGDMNRDGLLDFDEIFRFYLAVVKFPLKKASETAQSFINLGDRNKDGKLSLREILNIMDEAKQIARARKLIKMENTEDLSEAKQLGENEIIEEGKNLTEDKQPLKADNSGIMVGENKLQSSRKDESPEEQNVDELHNLPIAMK
ncbi:uncharacterized protein LOC133178988 [Saccostrea echinata]|uniref:uncharacterized protein LOC133178988 n=1 Tax=Saccostrea echinata TaxID=191078 RepID=UPI002A81D47B|nr:uncharacterized protein LOC133178988 [Saccostrea echinata]